LSVEGRPGPTPVYPWAWPADLATGPDCLFTPLRQSLTANQDHRYRDRAHRPHQFWRQPRPGTRGTASPMHGLRDRRSSRAPGSWHGPNLCCLDTKRIPPPFARAALRRLVVRAAAPSQARAPRPEAGAGQAPLRRSGHRPAEAVALTARRPEALRQAARPGRLATHQGSDGVWRASRIASSSTEDLPAPRWQLTRSPVVSARDGAQSESHRNWIEGVQTQRRST
jgi:hypothetical protein